MTTTEQGVLQRSKSIRLLACLLLSIIFSLSLDISAANSHKEPEHVTNDNIRNNKIYLIYLPESKLQSEVADKIAAYFETRDKTGLVTHVSPSDDSNIPAITAGLVIAIGNDSTEYAEINFEKTDTIHIVSNSAVNRPTKTSTNRHTTLYMSQPYCRQIHMIKEINNQWKTISYLHNNKSFTDRKPITNCAKKYGMGIYRVNTNLDDNLSDDVKKALANSDLILALPNKDIYNSKTVKNILLTSYRNRKPIIGFSKNFVHAGALAAMHSDANQIAESAINIIDDYYGKNKKFKKKINYPKNYDITINRQVFRALNLPIPDTDKIINKLTKKESGMPQ